MAGHNDPDSKADAEASADPAPFGKAPSLHREPPVIEGKAFIEGEPAPATEPETHEHPEAAPIDEPVTSSETEEAAKVEEAAAIEASAPVPPDGPHIEPETVPPDRIPPPRQGLSPVAIVIVAVIGVVTGFGSAYITRLFLDDTSKNIASLEERLTALTSKLTADEKKIDASVNANRDALSALEKRVSAGEKSASEALTLAAEAPAIAAKNSSSDTSSPAAPPPPPPPDLAPLESHVDTLDERLTQLESKLNAPKSVVRAPQDPESKPDPKEANAPAIAIIAQNLVEKISSGAPFASEISALDKLGADKTKLAALQPSAAQGVVTVRALADQFAALAPTLLSSEKPADQSQESWAAKLLNHASSLVHVRRVDDLSGDDLPARVARVQADMAHGDTDAALQEWDNFPPAQKNLSAAWAEAVKTRTAALATAKTIASDAMANLAKVKS